MPRLRYYISGHGLGHASRSCQIINTLRRRHPAIAVEVVSDAQPWFFAGFLDPAVPVRRLQLDLGVLQHDSLEMDEARTLEAWRRLQTELPALVRQEAASLRAAGVTLVAADVPAAAFAAAALAGIRAVAVSNFSWDWIYEGLAERQPGFAPLAEALRRDYGRAERLLRLPFHADLPAFARTEDLPLVARRSRQEAAATRRRIGLPEGVKVALISFGGFGLRAFDFSPLGRLGDWVFLTESAMASEARNVVEVPAGSVHYPDLVRAADVVVTKPGYGIVAEAIAAGTAVLYTPRGDFREQALLVAGLHRYARAREIGNEPLRRGEWGDALEALVAQAAPAETLPVDGDAVAADRLARLAEG